MYERVKKSSPNKSRAAAHSVGQKKGDIRQRFGVADNRLKIISDNSLQVRIEHSDDPGINASLNGIHDSGKEPISTKTGGNAAAIQRVMAVEVIPDPFMPGRFYHVNVTGRPPTLLGTAQGNHYTAFAVFVSATRNCVRGQSYINAFNNLRNLAVRDHDNLPGLRGLAPDAPAPAAYDNLTRYIGSITPGTRDRFYWVTDLQGIIARYLRFRNLVPNSTEAGEGHGGQREGDIVEALEVMEEKLRNRDYYPDYNPPKDRIRQLFAALYDNRNTANHVSNQQHYVSLQNSFPSVVRYLIS